MKSVCEESLFLFDEDASKSCFGLRFSSAILPFADEKSLLGISKEIKVFYRKGKKKFTIFMINYFQKCECVTLDLTILYIYMFMLLQNTIK